MKHVLKKVVVALVLLGLVGGAAAWYFQRDGDQAVTFRTAKVTRGDLLITIGATGTVEPEEVIDVGAQVAGQIVSFGKDADGKTIDYGSHVEEGTVLAQIDDTLYTRRPPRPPPRSSRPRPLCRGQGRPRADEGQALPGPAGLGAGPEARTVGGPGADQLRQLQIRLRDRQGQRRRGRGRHRPGAGVSSLRPKPRASGRRGIWTTARSSRRSRA